MLQCYIKLMKSYNSNSNKNLIDFNITFKNYFITSILFILLSIFLIKDRDNLLFTQTNIFTQLVILIGLAYLTCIIFLISKTDLSIFLSCLLFSFFSIICIRLYITSYSFRFLFSIIIFYLYSTKLNHILDIIVSIASFIIIIYSQSNLTVFGLSFPHYSSNELINLYFLQFVILSFILSTKIKNIKIHDNKATILMQDLYIQKLIDNNLSFQNLAAHIDKESRIEERLHVTREIHDITGYTLTSTIMMLEYCQDLINNNKNQEAIELLKTTNEQAREGHNEIRSALKQLRKIEHENIPFEKEIEKIIQNFRKITGMAFHVEYTNFNMEHFPEYNNVILRFIQEGLTNSFKHGKATKIKLIFFLSTNEIIISIEDNGIGNEKVIEGIGLSGMKERLLKYDGTLKYFSTSMGFTIIAHLPKKR